MVLRQAERMEDESEKQEYLKKMQAERGYVLDFHKILADEDLAFLKSYNALLQTALFNPDSEIEEKTKRLILIAVLLAVRSPSKHIETHMRAAKALGVTKAEMLEVLKMTLMPAGLPAFMEGFEIWRSVFEV